MSASKPTKKPPTVITLQFCPVCGRNDRYIPFTGKSHMTQGARCPGRLVTVGYTVRADDGL